MVPDLATFVGNLSWTPALVDCCRAWLGASRDAMEPRFRDYCGQNGKLEWMLTAFRGLPDGPRQDFLLSPVVSHQLLGRDLGREPSFAALAREFVRVLARSTGNAAADPDLTEMLLPYGRDHGAVQGIPLDLDSAFAFPSRGANAGELQTLPPDRVPEVKRRLEAALETLRQGNPAALDCVRLMIRRLAIREEPGRPEGCASSSFGQYVGLTLLTNPWAERVDAAWLIDALVHESIHSALFFCEVSRGSVLFDRSETDPVRSPWTGNLLPGYQYVHACFVWFGLAQLWGGWPAGAGGVPAAQIGPMHRKASQGFQARPVESLLSQEAGRRLAPPVREALCLLERRALDAGGRDA